MFSRSLFKQSCKANGTMWTIITVAVCFMLACVMLIAGGDNLSDTKVAIEDTIIDGELNSQIKARSLNYYYTADTALAHFDKYFSEEFHKEVETKEMKDLYQETYNKYINNGTLPAIADLLAKKALSDVVAPVVYKRSIDDLHLYVDSILESKNIEKGSVGDLELRGLIFTVLNPINEEGNYVFDSFYEECKEDKPRYELTKLALNPEYYQDPVHIEDRRNYTFKNSSIFLAGNMVKEENINMILNELSRYGVTLDKYKEFGYDQYAKVKEVGTTALVNFRANFEYRLAHMQEGETELSIVEDLTKDITTSLLASLPEDIAIALDEIGQADLYGVLVGSIFFKMAGLLLPIIFMIMTANSLIAGQVDSGSMAYILSTSVKRRTVAFTQAIYLITSLFTMFFCTTITSLVCYAIVDVNTSLTVLKLILINLGAFLVLFAMSGISFLASCIFNRSKRSMAIGGGINMFFLVATMLGLFGSEVLPNILRMDALNAFNYVSIISLFDVVSILEEGYLFIPKLLVLVAIGLVCYFVGSKRFIDKDLPL